MCSSPRRLFLARPADEDKVFRTSVSQPLTGSSCTMAGRQEPATSSATRRMSNRRVGFIGPLASGSKVVPAGEWIPVRAELIMDQSILEPVPTWYNSGRGWAARDGGRAAAIGPCALRKPP